jgi:hypothetical protein
MNTCAEVPLQCHANLRPEAAFARRCGTLEPGPELAVDEDRHRRRVLLLGSNHVVHTASLSDSVDTYANLVSIRRVVQVALSPNPEPGFCDEPSRFEMLAFEVGISQDELRLILRKQIAAKLGWASPHRLIVCSGCGCEFELSDRRARELVADGNPRCQLCRRDPTPGAEMDWLKTLPLDVLEKAVAALAALAA